MAYAADVEWSAHEESSDGSEDLELRPPATRTLRVAVLGAIAAVVVVCCVVARQGAAPAAARASAVTNFNSAGEAEAAAALAAADKVEENGFGGKLTPNEHLHDGNPCNDDEEFFGGLCYERCAVLTGGSHVYRQSPWTCCNQATCSNVFKLSTCCRHNMGMCSGFDIAGMEEGSKVCPHNPGACLADEELFLDVCYMKCSLLTNGEYPYRTASATCCKSKGIGCWVEDGAKDGLDGQAITSSSLAVGGGCGDSHLSTPCAPHSPNQTLTEA